MTAPSATLREPVCWQTTCTEIIVLTRDNPFASSAHVNMDQVPVFWRAGSTERRKRTRIRLHWPVDLFASRDRKGIETVTRDLSSRGFYCLSPVPFIPGERMLCILKAPAHTHEKPDCVLPIECQVRIVHVEPANSDGFYGLGCEINDYKIPVN
jgi:hypothetical protein